MSGNLSSSHVLRYKSVLEIKCIFNCIRFYLQRWITYRYSLLVLHFVHLVTVILKLNHCSSKAGSAFICWLEAPTFWTHLLRIAWSKWSSILSAPYLETETKTASEKQCSKFCIFVITWTEPRRRILFLKMTLGLRIINLFREVTSGYL